MSNLVVNISTTRNEKLLWLMATLSAGCETAPSIGVCTPVLLSTLSSVTIPAGFSGRLYFFCTDDQSSIPTTPSAITTALALRYDWIEITYDGSPTACANLTSVDQFGLAMSLSTLDATGGMLQSVGYQTDAATLIQQCQAVAPDAIVSDGSQFLRVVSPLHIPAAYPSLQTYLHALEGQSLRLTGKYDGGKDAKGYSHRARSFDYSCEFDLTQLNLRLTAHPDSQITGTIQIASADFMKMIYACDGQFNVPRSSAGPFQNGIGDSVGFNDPWSAVVRNFIAGFNLGFYGYSPSLNQHTYNCNHSWNWLPQFAFQNTMTGTPDYNRYAAIVTAASNSYGFPFSDLLGKPLVSLANASSLQITLFADNESGGYTPPPATSLSPVASLNPQGTGETSLAVIFDAGVGQPHPYTGKLIFENTSYSFGQYCWFDHQNPSISSAPGNCTINWVPFTQSEICQYQFSIQNKPFNLYLQFDTAGNILQSVVDGGLTATVSATHQQITISGIQNHIAPLPAKSETPETVDILCVIDATTLMKAVKNGLLHSGSIAQPTPLGSRDDSDAFIFMIADSDYVVNDQTKSELTVKCKVGDTLRWTITNPSAGLNYNCMLYDFTIGSEGVISNPSVQVTPLASYCNNPLNPILSLPTAYMAAPWTAEVLKTGSVQYSWALQIINAKTGRTEACFTWAPIINVE
ncbi:hypothetical protein H8K38_01020 [Undibacterium sp. FT79W]|uniref:AidA/PixA family protein n=1 Tax=Undibacterium sp. FT79W TaxID=2762296 RepID=UPI00164BD542|nr:AidA/PixA family protein [Undibacterium sp. FT79W]MBC3876380.1 hypothetical protein [Undibacterium sp. FT79W]